ncbi:acyl-CoA thioesterase [Aestuariibacter salexigens]|uniref:acyl-CoA thioesterase n=1 Tax=Aestuariibacter salexigens TaxID=226010 RepID=UPI0004054257|nr:thioesterase family protein [Aestuariibacter salexigens]
MHIDELLSQLSHSAQAEGPAVMTIDKSWTQGRTAFGGISAALTYASMKNKVAEGRVLRSFSCNFVGPLGADTPFEIHATMLREGKNVSQVTGEIRQDGKTCLMAQACFGEGRESKIRVENQDTHNMQVPAKPKFLPYIPKVTPKFLKHVDLAIVHGGLPFTNSKVSDVHGWMRFKKPPQTVTDAHLIALIDAWPPTILQMLRWPSPASTVSWNIEFIHPHAPVEPTDWFAYQAHTRQAAEGYGHTEANIWDARGELVALSRQTVAVFD